MDVTSAVERAKIEISSLFPAFAGRDLQLEEAETPLSIGRWRFIFSASVAEETTPASSFADILRPRRLRKTVELESETGALIAIKAA